MSSKLTLSYPLTQLQPLRGPSLLLATLHPIPAILPTENTKVGKEPIRFPMAPWGFDLVLDPGGLSSFLTVCCSDISGLWGNTPRRKLALAGPDPYHTQQPSFCLSPKFSNNWASSWILIWSQYALDNRKCSPKSGTWDSACL